MTSGNLNPLMTVTAILTAILTATLMAAMTIGGLGWLMGMMGLGAIGPGGEAVGAGDRTGTNHTDRPAARLAQKARSGRWMR